MKGIPCSERNMSALKRQTIQIQIPMLPLFTSDATTLNTLLNLSDPHFMHQENFALILPAHTGHLLCTSTSSSTEESRMSKTLLVSTGSSEPVKHTG